MHYQPKNILVTGAAGFIGSNFVRNWLAKANEVNIISYDSLTYAGSLTNLENLSNEKNHTFIEGDISDQILVAKILRTHQIDTIVHFAAESHVDNSIKNPKLFLKTNVLGTYHLLEAARCYWHEERNFTENQCRFHQVSTDEVYGTLGVADPAFSETMAYQPNSPYSASKAGADHMVRAYHHTYQLPITISNCSNNYGPYQHPEKLIPVVIHGCLAQKSIPVYGDGSNIRDWLYVGDHCEALNHILISGRLGEVYNIGGNNELSNLTLIQKICQLMDRHIPTGAPHDRLIQFVDDRKGHDWRYAIDNTKIKKELNWSPSVNFEAMLNHTIEYFLKKTRVAV